MSVISFAVSWVLNVWIIAFRYDGFNKGSVGRAVAGSEGNLYTAGVFWGILSMVVVSFVTYGFTVGWRQTLADLATLPSHFMRLVRESGGEAWSLVLWAAATMLVVTSLLSDAIAPAIAGVAGLGFLLAAPSAVSGVLGRLIGRFWAGAMARLSPSRKPSIPGLGGSLVGMAGSAAGLIVASQVPDIGPKLVVAVLCAIGAYLVVSGGTRSASAAVIVLVGVAAGWLVMSATAALADDGGWAEFQSQVGGGFWDWLGWEPTQRILRLSLGPAFASFAGSIAGASIGSVLATLRTIPGSWRWLPSDDDVVPPGDDPDQPLTDLGDARPIDDVVDEVRSGGDGRDVQVQIESADDEPNDDTTENGMSGPSTGDPASLTDGLPDDHPTQEATITLEGADAEAALDAWRRSQGGQVVDIPIPESEQWGLSVSDGDDTTIARSGHIGTRGEITSIDVVAESGDDVVITITVDAYVPEGDSPPPPIEADTPSSGQVDDGETTTEPVDDGAINDEPEDHEDENKISDDQPEDQEDGPDAEEEEATGDDPTDVRVPDEDPPGDGDSPDGGEESGDAPPGQDSGDSVLDGSDPGELADWAENAIAESELTGREDADKIGDLIRGEGPGLNEDGSVTLSGDFGGRFGPLLQGNVTDRANGIAVDLPTRDALTLTVRGGEVHLRHEASLIGLLAEGVASAAESVEIDIPAPSDIIENAQPTLDAFNRALAETDRIVTSIDANPDGTITISTGPRN